MRVWKALHLIRDSVLALISVIIYNVYWRQLSVEERFIRRNKLEAKS